MKWRLSDVRLRTNERACVLSCRIWVDMSLEVCPHPHIPVILCSIDRFFSRNLEKWI